MKLSLNTIRDMNVRYHSTTQDVTAIGTNALVDKINTRLGGVEEITELGSKFQGIIIARVVSCEKHPNADRLNVAMIDDGGIAQNVERDAQGFVQVVCGAPNVRAGISVAWLPPGATVPDSVGSEPFVLSARELRGVVSNGMLASPKELAISDNHDGILEIDDDFAPGTDFAEAFNLTDDVVLDIENKMFTHRPDCFGFLGVARELAGIQGISYTSPDWYTPNPVFPEPETELPLVLDNRLPELSRRFVLLPMSDITIAPSPVWLQVKLAKVGARPINNIVDLTNFFMLETGQPLHAYDYDKIKALGNGDARIVVRHPEADETIKLLNGKTITPRAEAIMIASDKQLIGVGGVMGGFDTEVDEQTKNIILECANFDMYSVRRTSMANGLFTDAVTRFNKGQSPLQNLAVLAKIVDDIQRIAGGKVAGPVIDDNHLSSQIMSRNSLHAPVTVTAQFVTDRLGLSISVNEMKTLLENVEFRVELNDQSLTITAPFWRTDIELREDIVEEIGRLHGFDSLPLSLPKRVITPIDKDPLMSFKANIRHSLVAAGANELLTYSFVHKNLLDKVGQDSEQAYKISNALSPDLQYYRLSITPSLLEKVHPNIKAGYSNFALFEMGKAHILGMETDGLPTEFEHLSLVLAADKKSAPAGAAYYLAQTYLTNTVKDLGISGLTFEPLTDLQDQASTFYASGRSAKVLLHGEFIGCIGEYSVATSRALKLPDFCAGFEISVSSLLVSKKTLNYAPLPRFPKVSQDITLKVPSDVSYQSVYVCLQAALVAAQPDQSESRLAALDIYQKEDAFKQITLRITIANHNRTLTDKEVAGLLVKVADTAGVHLGAEQI